MMKYLATIIVALAWFTTAPVAHADTAQVVTACGSPPNGIPYTPLQTEPQTQNPNAQLCIAGTITATNPSVSTNGSAIPGSSTLVGGTQAGNLQPLNLDGSGNLNVNCTAGCAGGTFNNNADGVATSATNGQSAAWLYLWNGTGWDRAQDDGSKNLKVNCVTGCAASGLGQGSSTTGQLGSLDMGAATTGAPTYTTGTTNPLSLDLAGNLRTNCVAGCSTTTANIKGNAGGIMDAAQAGATAPANALLTSQVYNATQPAPTTGQAIAIQADPAGNTKSAMGNVQVNSAATWNSSTGSNSTLLLLTNSGQENIGFQVDTTTTITGGALTFEGSYDGGTTWVTIPANNVIDPTTDTTQANPYTLVANTQKSILVEASAYQQVRVRLSTVISGTGAATLYYNQVGYSGPAPTIGYTQASTSANQLGNLVMGATTTAAPTYTTGQTDPLSLTTAGAVRVDASATTQPVSGTVAVSGSVTTSPPANASTNIAQVNGSTVSTSGTGQMKVGIVGNAGATLDQAQGSAVPTNGQMVGGGSVAGGTTYENITVKAASTAAAATDTSVVTQQNIAGAAMATAAAGVQKVGVVGNAGAAVDSATGAAPPANAILQGTVASGATGGLVVGQIQADSSAAINISTATTTQIVALVASRKIYVTGYAVVVAGADNITFEYGTGASCGTGTTVLTGAMNFAANGGISMGGGEGPVLVVPAGNALCVVTSAAVQASGHVSYAQF